MEFDFSQPVTNLDSVPNDFKGLYTTDDDGKISLRADDAGVKAAVSAITGLNSALKASRGETKALKGQKPVDLSSLSAFGTDPASILEGINNKVAEAGKGKKSNEDFDRQIEKIKGDLAQTHATDLKASTARGDALQNQLYGHLVTSSARTALAEAGAIDSDLALPFLERQVKVIEADGQLIVNVVDKAGDPRFSGVTGSVMSVKELVAEMKSDAKYGPLFKSEKNSGGGTGADNRRQSPRQTKREDMSPAEKIRAGLDARQKK